MKKNFFLFLILFNLFSNKVYCQWGDVQLGTNKRINCFYIDSVSNLLFVGGQFSLAGGMNINNIATWDGTIWNQYGNNEVFSSPGAVSAIVNYNGNIIVGGQFDSIGPVRVNNIAAWNGSNWETIGNGFDGSVNDLIIYKGELYACGSFAYSGTDRVDCFAKWNGINWVRVSLLQGSGTSFAIFNEELIIAGGFNHQNIASIVNILGWDGIDIDSTFGYFSDAVINIRNIDDTLYAVGSFTANVTNPSNYISLFYNNSWHSIGSPTGGSNWITDVIKFNNQLYLSGYFTNPPDLCKYNGSGFDSVADVLGFIQHLIEYRGDLYAGGMFSQLNGNPIYNIAKYNVLGNYLHDDLLTSEIINIYPNPSDGRINLSFSKHDLYFIEIFSHDGKLIIREKINQSFELNLLPGFYFVKATTENNEAFLSKVVVF